MVCPNCGAVNADNNTFCEQCGAGLAQAQPTAAYAPNPAVDAVKRLGASKLFLIAAILLSVMLLFNCINAIVDSDNAFVQITTAVDQFGGDGAFGALDGQRSSVPGVVIGMLPNILFVVGVWMTYAAAANTSTSGMKTTGLTMIKVMTIISLVLICLVTVLFEVVFALLGGTLAGLLQSELSDPDAAMIANMAITVMQIFLIPIMALFIVYLALMISTINKVKKTVTTGVAYYKASGFVAVMNFLTALILLLSAFAGTPLQAIVLLCNAAAEVLFGILIFQYRSALRPIAEMQMMPPAAPYAPVAPYAQATPYAQAAPTASVAPTAPVAPSAPAAELTAAPTQDTQE